MIQSRNLIFHTKLGLKGLIAHLKFGVGTASGLRVMRVYVKELYRPTDDKRSKIGPRFK